MVRLLSFYCEDKDCLRWAVMQAEVHVLALCLGRGIFLPGPLPLVRKIGRADGARPPGQLWGDTGLRPSLRQSV